MCSVWSVFNSGDPRYTFWWKPLSTGYKASNLPQPFYLPPYSPPFEIYEHQYLSFVEFYSFVVPTGNFLYLVPTMAKIFPLVRVPRSFIYPTLIPSTENPISEVVKFLCFEVLQAVTAHHWSKTMFRGTNFVLLSLPVLTFNTMVQTSCEDIVAHSIDLNQK